METLLNLYKDLFGHAPARTEPIQGSGSNRAYYRFFESDGRCTIACRGTAVRENDSFLALSRHFAQCGLPVPRVLAVSPDRTAYLQESVGKRSLFDALQEGRRKGGHYSEAEQQLIERTLRLLPHVQVEGARGLDFSVCYPAPELDRTGILFDLNYFKYCFLKTSSVEFDEYLLEADFQAFASDLLSAKDALSSVTTFLYRDFQARNIMLDDEGGLHLIDYQGGRRGPLPYDVVSFLWQASSLFPDEVRQRCIGAYLDELAPLTSLSKDEVTDCFMRRLPLFVLFRQLQVLGAYGFRGRYERKQHFLDSIPAALDNLRQILPQCPYPYLHDTCLQFFL